MKVSNILVGLGVLSSSLLSQTMFVKQDANIRSNPSLESKIVGYYKKNAPIEVIKKVYTKDAGTWYQTDEGYISIELLKNTPRKTNKEVKEYIIDNCQYCDAKKEPITLKETFIDKKTDTVYTLIPKELIPVKKEPKESYQIHGNFDYAKVFLNEVFQTQEETKAKEEKPNDKYFVGLSFGINSFDVTKTQLSGAIEIDNPDKSANTFKLQGGVYINNYAIYGNYEYSKLNNLNLQSLYLSGDYIFNHHLNPYLGVSLGYIQGDWTKDLLVNSVKTKDQKMSSLLYGVQTGFTYPLQDNWYFNTQLSYQKFELTTDLISTPAKSVIEYRNRKVLEIGVRYRF